MTIVVQKREGIPLAFFISKRTNKWRVGKITDKDKNAKRVVILIDRELYNKIDFRFPMDLSSKNKGVKSKIGRCSNLKNDGCKSFEFLNVPEIDKYIMFYQIWNFTLYPYCKFVYNPSINRDVLSVIDSSI